MTQIEPRKRLSGEERDKVGAALAEMYEGGASIRQIAESTGRSYGFVNKILPQYTQLRPRGGAGRKKADAKA